MEIRGQNYTFYFILEYLPPIIFFVLGTALSLLLIPVQLLLNRSPKLKRYVKTQLLIKHIFSTMLNNYIDKSGKQICTILNYKVPERYKVMMLAMMFSMTGAGGMIFWDICAFDDSYICSTDPDLACFPAYPSITTPRLDCSNTSFLEDNNITSVICYRPTFKLGQATGGALGTIAMNVLYIMFITVILLKVSNGSEWNKRRAVLTIAIQITIVVITLVVTVSIFFLPGPKTTTLEKRIILLMLNLSFHYTILYSTVLFPWWSFSTINDKDDNKENDKEESSAEYRRVRGTSIPI